MAKKLAIWNERMLTLMQYVIDNKIKGIEFKQDFLRRIKINSGATLKPIREGKQSFTLQNFHEAAKLFNVSMEWFFGFTDAMKRNSNSESVEELLQQALIQLKSKK